MPRVSLLALALLFAVPSSSAGDVIASGSHGFATRSSAFVPFPAATAYACLVQEVGGWWSSDHTVSGNAENLRIEARAGGCFCETLPGGGSVRHLTIVAADPGKLLRMAGGLGPLQAEAVNGSLSWQFSESPEGTEITLTYAVGGYAPGGLEGWSEAADRVLAEQLARLSRYLVSGSASEPDVESDTEP